YVSYYRNQQQGTELINSQNLLVAETGPIGIASEKVHALYPLALGKRPSIRTSCSRPQRSCLYGDGIGLVKRKRLILILRKLSWPRINSSVGATTGRKLSSLRVTKKHRMKRFQYFRVFLTT